MKTFSMVVVVGVVLTGCGVGVGPGGSGSDEVGTQEQAETLSASTCDRLAGKIVQYCCEGSSQLNDCDADYCAAFQKAYGAGGCGGVVRPVNPDPPKDVAAALPSSVQ